MEAKPPSSSVETLSGLIERVTFFNEETGFAVLQTQVKGHRDWVTVVGSLASVAAGEWLTAEGRWGRDKEHGLQFRAESLRSTPPTTREGIEKYLGSGLIKGIGPVYAKKLVNKFGEQVFEIIEHFSAKLEEVDGIGASRRKRIKAAWQDQKIVREIMVFLHSHGVSTSRAVRIYKAYGDAAIEKVRQDPYTLAKDIPGIGFKSADQIAQRLGLPKDSLARASAGLVHVLLEAMDSGHCALPRHTLLERAGQLLEIDVRIAAEGLARTLQERAFSEEVLDGEHLIFLPALARAEARIASEIHRLAALPAQYPPIDAAKAIAWCEQKTGKLLSVSQKEAFEKALRHRVLIITGGPGVGKTTLLNSILAVLRAKKLACLLCAPTGRAAKRLSEATGLNAQTIHRLLEYAPATGGFTRNERRPLEANLLVVDETSMMDVKLMNALLRAAPLDGHLLLVGDVDQLPSVGPGNVLRDLIQSGCVPVIRLTEVFRQAAASRIISAAHNVNQGRLPELPPKDEPSDFYFIEREQPDQILKTLIQVVQERLPKKVPLDARRDVQVLCPMNRGTLGARELNARLQHVLNPLRTGEPGVEKFGWQFRMRDKVIQTANNYDKGVFNGDIGEVSGIDSEEREVTVRFEDRSVVYDYGELDEISLAYALTIHKAQGSEFPAVVIPLSMQHYRLLQRNLLYTAITRGKQFVVLIGQKKALAAAVRNAQATRRFSGLLDRLRDGSHS